MNKVRNLNDFKNEREGKVTPKACIEDLLEAIDRGEVKSVVFTVKKTDDEIASGWSDQTFLQALGMFESGKRNVFEQMEED